jgi:hypothetical protein
LSGSLKPSQGLTGFPAERSSTGEKQTIRFAIDQEHTTATFRGIVVGGTGRFSRARGTVSGGGPGLNGKADWSVTIHLR